MRKQELDEIITTIKERYSIDEFEITNSGETTNIVLNDSGLSFGFGMDIKSFRSFVYSYTTYTGIQRGSVNKSDYQNFFDAKGAFIKWLTKDVGEFLKERDFPDPLERLKSESKLFGNITHDTSKFSTEEKKEIRLLLETFQKQVEEKFKVDAQIRAHIVTELKYLSNQVETLNKRDWVSVAQKIIYDLGVNITSNLILSAGNAVVAGSVAKISPTFIQVVVEIFKMLFHK